jgi:predicted amidohydrolase YtcJ
LSITVYQAAQVLTMNPSNPSGTHVAVRNGMILGVGSLEQVAVWGEYRLDDRFKDHVICPGFVEAHAHVMEGASGLMP